ncbi:fimbrial protein [Burkholderia multivorans]|uniref:fimbrial protein n=1 Tax=Burkholderia ubonensis TaxID=101571 RepID=UPI000F713D56|nr:fimbrial protein [Burkholderia ubonensis]AYZ63505.1 fimbrial protein [Burkholderia multivorans]
MLSLTNRRMTRITRLHVMESIERKGMFEKKLRWVRAAIVASSLIWSGAAFGSCSYSGPWSQDPYNVTFPATMNVAAAPVGGVLARSEVQFTTSNSLKTVACWSPDRIDFTITVPDGQLVPGYNGVYKTNVDGIGVRFVFVASDQDYIPPWSVMGGNPNWGAILYTAPYKVRVELIRTATNVASGGSVSLAFNAVFGAVGPTMAKLYIRGQGTTQVTNDIYFGGCKTTTPVTNVRMGKEPIERIKSGRTPEYSFSLEVACGTNKPGKPLPVKVYFEGDNEAAGLLRLSGRGTPGVAAGVGIALTSDKGAKLPFTQADALTMDWNRSSPDGEVYRFTGKAKYAPTTGAITAGSGNATLNFVVQYN